MILLGICISGSCGLSVLRGNILGRKHTRVMIMICASEIGGTDIIEGSIYQVSTVAGKYWISTYYLLYMICCTQHALHPFPGKEGAKGCGVRLNLDY